MRAKEKVPAGGGTPTGTGQEKRQGVATIPCSDCTTNTSEAQGGGRIFSLLLPGEQNAIPGPELARMAGVSPRTLRIMVDRERLRYPICASDRGYFLPDEGNRGILELRKFLRRQDSRCAANRRVTKSARMALKALEKAPLPGQTDFWQGG